MVHHGSGGNSSDLLRMGGPPHDTVCCWGSQLAGHTRYCTVGFTPGTGHFKNKFCPSCHDCIEVHFSRVHVLKPNELSNGHGEGFWKRATAAMGGGKVRIVNNTLTCIGPQLVVYEEPPQVPPDPDRPPLPENWVEENVVTLCVAKGTLVPVQELRKTTVKTAGTRAKRRRRRGDRGLRTGRSAPHARGSRCRRST